MKKKTVFWVLLVVVLAVTSGLLTVGARHGLFLPIKVAKQEFSPIVFAYQKHEGPFSKIGPVMEQVIQAVKAEGLTPSRGIGVYYEKPGSVPDAKLRSLGGCILEGLTPGRVLELRKKLSIAVLPGGQAIFATFPYKSDLSYVLGPMKVWRKIATEVAQTPMVPTAGIEIYDHSPAGGGPKIEFLMFTGLGMELFEDLWKK